MERLIKKLIGQFRFDYADSDVSDEDDDFLKSLNHLYVYSDKTEKLISQNLNLKYELTFKQILTIHFVKA